MSKSNKNKPAEVKKVAEPVATVTEVEATIEVPEVQEPTEDTAEPVIESPPKERGKKPNLAVIPANPALIQWPTDVWGLTKDLKRAFIALASRINGHADKKQLVDEVLHICVQHVEQKFTRDNDRYKAQIAKSEAEANGEQLRLF